MNITCFVPLWIVKLPHGRELQGLLCWDFKENPELSPSVSSRQAAAISGHLMVYSKDGVGLRAKIFPLLSLEASESGSVSEGKWRQETNPSGWEWKDTAGPQPRPLWMESCVWHGAGREEGSRLSQTGHGHYSSQERKQPSEECGDTAFNKFFRKLLIFKKNSRFQHSLAILCSGNDTSLKAIGTTYLKMNPPKVSFDMWVSLNNNHDPSKHFGVLQSYVASLNIQLPMHCSELQVTVFQEL